MRAGCYRATERQPACQMLGLVSKGAPLGSDAERPAQWDALSEIRNAHSTSAKCEVKIAGNARGDGSAQFGRIYIDAPESENKFENTIFFDYLMTMSEFNRGV